MASRSVMFGKLEEGRIDEVRNAIKLGQCDTYLDLLFCKAAGYDCLDLMKRMLRRGVKRADGLRHFPVDREVGLRAFYNVRAVRHVSTLQWLYDTFSILPDEVRDCPTPLMMTAINGGHIEVVQWLVETVGLAYEDMRKVERMVYHRAVEGNQLPMLRWLYDNVPGVGRWFRSIDGPLDMVVAACNKHMELANWLAEIVEVDMRSAHGWRALRRAAMNNDPDALQWLCDTFGILPDEIRHANPSPLYDAIQMGCLEAVQWFVNVCGMTVENLRHIGRGVCGMLVANNKLSMLQWLYGNVPGAARWFGATDGPLDLLTAIDCDHLELARWLVEIQGIDTRGEVGWRMLERAANENNVCAMQWIFGAIGATVEQVRGRGHAQLTAACDAKVLVDA